MRWNMYRLDKRSQKNILMQNIFFLIRNELLIIKKEGMYKKKMMREIPKGQGDHKKPPNRHKSVKR